MNDAPFWPNIYVHLTVNFRRQDEPNIAPETETILETLGFEENKQDAVANAGGADDLNEIEEEDDNQVLAPRVRIGEDGNIIIDEERWVVRQSFVDDL